MVQRADEVVWLKRSPPDPSPSAQGVSDSRTLLYQLLGAFMTALSFRGVRKTFGPTVALYGLDLDIKDGELITLLGPSGCGKTTALRIAAGFEFADTGIVEVDGADISGTPAHKRNMGMVFQSYSLFPNLSVAQNIDFGLRTRKIDKLQRQKRVGEMLDLVQLGEFAGRYPHQLSGGQQQRVALARALAPQPQLLLLDEPLSALDAKVRATLRDEIKRIQTELGITTLFVTHDQDEALAISDRIGVMSSGRLEQLGTPTEVYRTPSTAFVARFVGSMNELRGAVIGHAVDVLSYRIPVRAAGQHPTGTPVLLLVRPEDCALVTEPEQGLSGTVTGVTFQGATTIVGVRLDVLDQLVNVETRAGTDPVIGSRVMVAVDGTRAVCEPAHLVVTAP
jgi:putative spermidine/putrescine transport system ATP-binding protein